MLVEDDDTIASLVTHILRRSGRPVLRASDGAGCVKLVREHRDGFALVILDCRLPDMDGAVLCRELREMVPNLPVLMTSGKNQPMEKVRAAGATAFLAKPFRPTDVERQVTTLIGAIT